MPKFFRFPWASTGDKTTIPDETDVAGFVSYQQGYGNDYARDPASDPLAKLIERDKMNQLYSDLTENVQYWQIHAFPEYITAAQNGGADYAYDIGAIVRYDDGGGYKVYQNETAGNTNLPTGAGWILKEGIAGLNAPDFVGPVTIDGDNVSPFSGFKNHIINGNFDHWQYKDAGLTYPQTASGYGSDDRWNNTNSGSTKTHSQVATTDTERPLFNASFFSRTVVTSVAGAGNFVQKHQKIENITKLAGKTVTLSFWAKADSSKNIAIEFSQNFGTGGAPSSQVNSIGSQLVALTSTWQKFTITVAIPSIVGKTLGTDGVHTSFLLIQFWFDAGTTFDTHTASLGQQSGTFDIAQVQIEEGSVATPFEMRNVQQELAMCQRYYESFINTSGGTRNILMSYGTGSNNALANTFNFLVEKRVTPTITQQNITYTNCTFSIIVSGKNSFSLQVSSTAVGIAQLTVANGATYITASAEL